MATDAPETQAEVKSVARQKGWEFKVVLDSAGEVSALLNPRGATPYSIFLDRNGNHSYDHEGYIVGDEVHYKPLIESLLAESAGGANQVSGGALSITETFTFSARGDNGDDVVDDDYYLGVNRLNITGGAGGPGRLRTRSAESGAPLPTAAPAAPGARRRQSRQGRGASAAAGAGPAAGRASAA